MYCTTQSDVICWLLDHNPHRRPTAEDLLQSEYIPPKMEDKELLEVCFQPVADGLMETLTAHMIEMLPPPPPLPLQVLTRTLSSTNSTSYQRLMAELFRQSVPVAQGFAYFYDLQTVSRSASCTHSTSACCPCRGDGVEVLVR